jgi:hypothetical protein
MSVGWTVEYLDLLLCPGLPIFVTDQAAGYTIVFVLDPIAARRGEVPLYFGRLRRLQIPIGLLALAIGAVIVVRT